MQDFLIKEILNADLQKEIEDIGFDKSYAGKAIEKFEYKNFKIYDITSAQANIIKQTALSVGADCATHRQVITGKIEKSDCILGGSASQLKKIAQKLEFQPFGLKVLAKEILKNISSEFPRKTKIAGILNITHNSFSDGGDFLKFEDSIKHLNQLINDGADIIDIGAESTKPYSTPVSSEVQIERILPILKYIKEKSINIPISIDTRSSIVAKTCIEHGASIINDVSGFDYDSKMAETTAQYPYVKIIIQHSKGTPENMQDCPQYENLIDEIFKNLKEKIDFAVSNGIKKENIVIDPGIGFGKTREQNFEIINRWKELKTLGCPIMLGLSRKSLLNIPQMSNEEKDLYTLALNSIIIKEKIDYIRVHNVKIHKILIDTIYPQTTD